MAKEPLSLKLAKNVELNRQRLVNKCYNSGKSVSKEASLDNVVDAIDSIEVLPSEQYHAVHFIDVDGSEFYPTQYIKHGDALDLSVIPHPNHDPEYLEFVQFDSDIQDTNYIDFECVVMPRYKVKDEYDNQTVLKCSLDELSGLTLSIQIYVNLNGSINIDWGDGNQDSVSVVSSRKTLEHTYSNYGNYDIKVSHTTTTTSGYFYFGTSSTVHIVGNNTQASALKSIYFNSDTFVISQYLLGYLPNLNVVVFAKSLSRTSSTYPNYAVYNSPALMCLNFSPLVWTGGNNFISNASTLRYLILPKNYSSNMTVMPMVNTTGLKYLILPEWIDSLPAIGVSNNYCLKKIKFYADVFNITESGVFKNNHALQEIQMNLGSMSIGESVYSGCESLKSITIPKAPTSVANITNNMYNLETLNLFENFNSDLNLRNNHSLTKQTLIDIANKIQNNINNSLKTLTFSLVLTYDFTHTYLNEYGIETTKDDLTAVTLLEFIQNKNWTVAFV